MDWDEERALMNDAADAITDRDFARYEAIKAAHPDYRWQHFDYRAAIASGKTIEELGPDPQWVGAGFSGPYRRASDRDTEKK